MFENNEIEKGKKLECRATDEKRDGRLWVKRTSSGAKRLRNYKANDRRQTGANNF